MNFIRALIALHTVVIDRLQWQHDMTEEELQAADQKVGQLAQEAGLV